MIDPFARHATAKGSTVRSTLDFVRLRFGREMVDRVFVELPADAGTALRAVAATDEIPYASVVQLWKAVHVVLADRSARWAEESGAHSIDSLGVQMYGGILRKDTPQAFLTGSISLFRLYYHPGDMEVVEDAVGRAVLRLVSFDPVTSLFCARQTGGLRRAIELAGGGAARVRHVRCAIEGDAFCEWELHWQAAGVKSTPP